MRGSFGRTRSGPLAIAVALCLVAVGCTRSSGDVREPSAEREGTIVVGVSGAFTENQIVAEMYAQVLEHAGFTVERQLDLRSREVSQNALESGQIDLKPEYLSSLLRFVDPNAEASNDPDDVVRAAPGSPGAARAHPADAFPGPGHEPVRGERGTAERFDLTTMTSLARVANQLTLGAPPECPQRPYCLAGLNERLRHPLR